MGKTSSVARSTVYQRCLVGVVTALSGAATASTEPMWRAKAPVTSFLPDWP